MDTIAMEAIYMTSLRWLHVIAGIIWIGLLYYFNFVQTPSFPKLEGGSRRDAFVNLVPTALWWFRWAALVTVLAGAAWMVSYGVGLGNSGGWAEYVDTAKFKSILSGAILGTIMMLNVWLIIWPNQKKIIQANTDGEAPDPAWVSAAGQASRTNTLLSIPMLFFMIASAHGTWLWGAIV